MKFKKGQIVQIRRDIEDISTDLTPAMLAEAGKHYKIRKIFIVNGDYEIYLDTLNRETYDSYWKPEELLPLAVNKGKFTNVKE